MNRRTLLGSAAALGSMAGWAPLAAAAAARSPARRVRPGDRAWPGPEAWRGLNAQVGGRLAPVRSPLEACAKAPGDPACAELFRNLRNPFFIGDDPALTQTLGWTDAWTSRPSAYVVAAESAADVAAAVNFARARNLRLVVKGGGHSYLGGSNAPDSLLIWTRRMNGVELHDGFVPAGGEGRIAPEHAVSVGAGAYWLQAYQKVTGEGGRYVQGGGCTTVGVAGLVQGGGFGSWSKTFGSGAASLLEAEVVTADGRIRVVNANREPDLFWALKGGGGGTFGVVTRMTLRTHPLPAFFGAARAEIKASSDAAYRALVAELVRFYAASLLNPHWGEQIIFRGRTVEVSMVFQGLSQPEAAAVWAPMLDWIKARPGDYALGAPLVAALPARQFWNPRFLSRLPGVIHADERPGASPEHFYWASNIGEAGQVLHGYQSCWLPQSLLRPERQGALVDALVASARVRGVSLHCNKGLAGGPAEALAASRDTATNPAVLDAFALAIAAGEGPPAWPGVPGHEPDVERGRRQAADIRAAMAPLRALTPAPASYVSETDYFQADWQTAFWGPHYPRLLGIKRRYDPTGLFYVHHGVGSEAWAEGGFERA